MSLDTFIDLILHVIFTYLAGYIVFKKWNKREVSFWGAFVGGILIDLDHFIDYFMTYGMRFNLTDFFQGMQFLKSGKIFVFFHAWEYLLILLIILYFLDKKRIVVRSFVAALSLSIFLHLLVDIVVAGGHAELYSIIYRFWVNFDLVKLTGQSLTLP